MNSGDLNSIIENYIKQYGTAPDVIESMNEFYSQGIELILSQFFKVEKPVANKRSETINGQNIETLKLVVTFHNVELLRPSDSGKIQYPADARLGGKTYSGRLTTDVHIKLTIFLANGKSIEREDIKHKHHIANIPIMVGSNMCNTWQMTNAALTSVQEDPTDPQGYFIINGSEWFINKLFSRKYNIFHVFHNEFEQDIEFARADIISMPGDSFENSSEMQTRYLKSGELVITLTSDRYFKLIGIPFYIILRLFGIQSEKAIVENIVPNSGFADTDNKMKSILLDMFLVKSKNFPEAREIDNLVDLRAYCIKVIANNYINTQSVIDLNQRQLDLEREIAILNEKFMSNLDDNVLPHQGKLPEHRFSKALYICTGINLILKCYLGIIPSTSRDSHEIKRYHTAGDSFSRMIKKELNKTIVNPIRKHFDMVAEQTPVENIDLKNLISAATDPSKTQSAIIKNLNTGLSDEKGADGKNKKNRMPSENFKRKGTANIINSLTVTRSPNAAGAFQNKRAYEMRRVAASAAGTNCVVQSSEGVNVGMTTNTTLGMKISKSTSTEVMISSLLESGYVIPWNKQAISPAAKVMVNGRWIGYTNNEFELIRHYQELRRGWNLKSLERVKNHSTDREHSITINYAIDFRTDRGRGLCPLIVVRNNTDADPIGQKMLGKMNKKTGAGFHQKILFTIEHVEKLRRGETSIADLFEEGIIDYIASEELKLVWIADTLEEFMRNAKNPKVRYTHLFIPITLLSCTSAFSPFLHHGPPTRTALATNHLRQACSIFSLYPNSRFDKQGFFSVHNEFPLVYTISNYLVPVNGINTRMLIASYGGGNMEDSLILNQSAADAGIFFTVKYTFFKSVREKYEEFCKPSESSVDKIRNNAFYAKLNDEGFIPIGTVVNDGDVIIGKRIQVVKTTKSGKNYEDRSEIYFGETARVCGVEKDIDSNFKSFISIRLEIVRRLHEGQKFASRMGQKGMTVQCFSQRDMPFNSAGEIPTIILNPHALPSRMTINQLIEALYAKMGIMYGKCFDGTFMIATDLEEVGEALEKKGLDRYGEDVYYSGFYGTAFDTTLFDGFVYYQRLQKFVEESCYATRDGPRNPQTRQPIAGKANNGGLRLGEMEIHCYFSHGAMRCFLKKAMRDCDGMMLHICRRCGIPAVANKKKNLYRCVKCNSGTNIVRVPSRFNPYMLLRFFETMGIKINYIMNSRQFLR